MGYVLKTKLANKSNYGSRRATSKIKYIVIHYTGNDGDTDEANANYFKNNIVKASAHYFVDDDSVTQSVPDNYIAWSVGGKKYANTSGAKYYQKCNNTNSISVELCDTVKDGKVYPSAKTIKNAVELVKKLMKKYDIPKDHVIRHYDVTGKMCPAYWCGTTAKNSKWKTAFLNKLEDPKKLYSGTFPSLPTSRKYYMLGDGYNTLKTYKAQIKRLQDFLNWCLDEQLKIDGKYDENTKNAVIKFQKKNGLTPDGKFGSKTLSKAKAIKK